MTYPTHDLTPLFAAPPAGGVGYRQGIVRAWNPATAENTVDVDGALVDNLSILNTNNDALQLAAGDVVGILTTGAAASSWAILGRLTIPGTPAAESLLSQVSSGIDAAVITTQQTTTSTTYTDLATVGPSATVTIRPTGKALVVVSSQMAFAEVSTQETGAAVSFVASGANSIGTSSQRSVNSWLSVGGPPASIGRTDQYGATFYLSGLNTGETTFTLKYKTQMTGKTAYFADRVIVVWPL
jgi:hypothetical protein